MDRTEPQLTNSQQVAARRRRQFWVQILLPVLLALTAVITLAVLSTRAQNSQVHQWGNISQVIVVIPVMASCLLGLAILAALILGIGKLLGILPGFFQRVQYYFYLAEVRVRQIADKVAEPIIKSRSTAGGVRRALGRKE